jgi:hypothetical protein
MLYDSDVWCAMREADGRSARRSVHAEARFRSSSVLEESANHPGRYGLVDAIDCATRHAAEFTTDYTIFVLRFYTYNVMTADL